jgi:hypothetical protein
VTAIYGAVHYNASEAFQPKKNRHPPTMGNMTTGPNAERPKATFSRPTLLETQKHVQKLLRFLEETRACNKPRAVWDQTEAQGLLFPHQSHPTVIHMTTI